MHKRGEARLHVALAALQLALGVRHDGLADGLALGGEVERRAGAMPCKCLAGALDVGEDLVVGVQAAKDGRLVGDQPAKEPRRALQQPERHHGAKAVRDDVCPAARRANYGCQVARLRVERPVVVQCVRALTAATTVVGDDAPRWRARSETVIKAGINARAVHQHQGKAVRPRWHNVAHEQPGGGAVLPRHLQRRVRVLRIFGHGKTFLLRGARAQDMVAPRRRCGATRRWRGGYTCLTRRSRTRGRAARASY